MRIRTRWPNGHERMFFTINKRLYSASWLNGAIILYEYTHPHDISVITNWLTNSRLGTDTLYMHPKHWKRHVWQTQATQDDWRRLLRSPEGFLLEQLL